MTNLAPCLPSAHVGNRTLEQGTGVNTGLGNMPSRANDQRDTSNSFLLNGVDASNLFNGKSTSQVSSARVVNNTGVSGAAQFPDLQEHQAHRVRFGLTLNFQVFRVTNAPSFDIPFGTVTKTSSSTVSPSPVHPSLLPAAARPARLQPSPLSTIARSASAR